MNIKTKEITRVEGGRRRKNYFKDDHNNKPLISIVTVVYNGSMYIEETINSVLNQTYDNIEYIIIDGGSTDQTLNIIQKYEEYIDYYLSEADNGISDAFNKGIKKCCGSYIGLLNAGDYYEKDAVMHIVNAIKDNADIIYGDIYYPEKQHISYGNYKFEKQIKYFMPRLNHPTAFVSSNTYKKVGFYKTNLKIAMDYDFFKRAYELGVKFLYLNHIITNMRLDGVSNTKTKRKIFEVLKISNNPIYTVYYILLEYIKYKNKIN
jgi:glycosyltransferase involved in cell wall biosynthesis